MTFSLAGLQKLGRALMLPVAVLPVAGILLRLGQSDLWGWLPPHSWFVEHFVPFIGASAEAIFKQLGLLFAVGVAVGFARENHGAAGLAGLVCYLIATTGAAALIAVPPEAIAGIPAKAADVAAAAYRQGEIGKFSVPAGILSGLIAGGLYNRFQNIKLPDYLAFFGGRRFVPIVSGFAGLGLGAVTGVAWPLVSNGIAGLSGAIVGSGNIGLFIYGALNRLLIVTGLHHILNNVVWFIVGDYHGFTGDVSRFQHGDPSAGAFMSGFFPVMMFGLPAACLAMYHAAPKDRRKSVGGMLLSMALTSFLTGVTEPIEFTFMFLAPLLYGVHVVLTGAAMVIMNLLGVKLGFSFSAGLFDYALNFNKATRPLLLVPVGLAYFGAYYGVFRWAIAVFKLKTPGREDETEAASTPEPVASSSRADGFVTALGGVSNLKLVDACTTRLRLEVADNAAIDEPALKRLGARGFVRPSPGTLQVVVGPIADQLAGEIRSSLRQAGVQPAARSSSASAGAPNTAKSPFDAKALAALIDALGGAANIRSVEARANRLRLEVADVSIVDQAAAKSAGARGVAIPAPGVVHLLTGPGAELAADGLSDLAAAGA
jgi:PTS system N-acetylglucosamine-specific IIC component